LLQPWFERNYLPIETIQMALDEVVEMGFTGGICLSHYNEPLMDERIVEIAQLAKSYGVFEPIFLNTNGDFLTEGFAQSLDGILDKMLISLYMPEPIKSKRAKWIKSLFHTTEAIPLIQSDHIATHYSPAFDVVRLAEEHINNKCHEPQIRVVINHQREYLLCCDDVVGNFDLGTFPEISIKDYWFGEKHQRIANDLKVNGGRRKHPYCASCPRR
jgi:hypothetical protein